MVWEFIRGLSGCRFLKNYVTEGNPLRGVLTAIDRSTFVAYMITPEGPLRKQIGYIRYTEVAYNSLFTTLVV